MRRLARHGLLEYPVGPSRDADTVVIEPQVADYWPQTPPLGNADVLVLSRFAYLRRRGNAMVLESPRAGALFRICDPKIATALAMLSTPQQVGRLRRQEGFPGIELLALLVDCQILFKVDADHDGDLRPAEGRCRPRSLGFSRSPVPRAEHPGPARQSARRSLPLCGRHTFAAGGAAPLARKDDRSAARSRARPATFRRPRGCCVNVIRSAASTTQRPITLAEIARFLDGTARVVSTWKSRVDLGDVRPVVAYATRPYPSAGASYELELYLAVDKCDGLARGFYHYDAGGHALVPIDVRTPQLDALFSEAQLSMDAPATPQIVITIAARFGRVSWKYSSLAYALILKDVGVLIQTLYLMATDMGLGGCAIGSTNIDLFAKMTGDRIPCRRSGRSIRAGPRQAAGDFRTEMFATRTIAPRAPDASGRAARSKYPTGGFSVFPPARMRRPAGPRIGSTQLPPAVSNGPSRTSPPPAVTRCAAASMSSVLK